MKKRSKGAFITLTTIVILSLFVFLSSAQKNIEIGTNNNESKVENEIITGDINNVSVACRYETTEGEFFSDFRKVAYEDVAREIGEEFIGMEFKQTSESFNKDDLNYIILLKNDEKLIGEIRFYDLDKIVLVKENVNYISNLDNKSAKDLVFKLITKFKPVIFE
ncbi:hypothetical protein [Tepidibacter hydrothermalis]|uniref:Uncharacterized protein n=1 Tax=Tepidibacter hydrothermalis TaxID=3036126 RepID=A0ABY8EBE9_9FIRM|nr:hypothetical protein [Tepidibacter hydrothermalis]WFD10248.1 hypothetical protein P4S50_18110 [Tepidibacter hydrothermalis]